MLGHIFMETTKISPGKTIGEVQGVLAAYGANNILIEYDNTEVSALSFTYKVEDQAIAYRLPSNWQVIYEKLAERKKRFRGHTKDDLIDQAKRIAWRTVLRWVEAQLAFVEQGQGKVEQVFMHCMIVGPNKQTLFQKMEESKWHLKQLKDINR